jgi:dCMP deaminase
MSFTKQQITGFLKRTYELASQSRDTSNQNGAIIVDSYSGKILSEGFNDFPTGCQDLPERHERPLKYSYFRHAERHACYNAAKRGNKTDGMTMICPWFACDSCAIAIIESGVRRVIGHQQRMAETPERWKENVDLALEMLAEAGVDYTFFDGPVKADPIIVNSVLWSPSGKIVVPVAAPVVPVEVQHVAE